MWTSIVSMGPSNCRRGSNPSPSVASVTTWSNRPRSPPGADAAPWRENTAVRNSLIVSSSPSTADSSRARVRCGSPTPAIAACRLKPSANSRWITVSCKSRAIRSRSSATASTCSAWRSASWLWRSSASAAKRAVMSRASVITDARPSRPLVAEWNDFSTGTSEPSFASRIDRRTSDDAPSANNSSTRRRYSDSVVYGFRCSGVIVNSSSRR